MRRRTRTLISTAKHTLISDALDEYLLGLHASRRSDRTIEFYQTNINRFIWWLHEAGYPANVDEVQASHIRLFLEYLQKNNHRWGSDHRQSQKTLCPSSVQAYFRALRAFFNFCRREDYTEHNPFESGRVQVPKAGQRFVKSYTAHEVQSMIDAARHDTIDVYRDPAIILLLVDTGLRAAELVHLTLVAFDDYKRLRHLRVVGKGDKERQIAMSPMTEKAVRDYVRRERPLGGESLFCGRGDRPLTTSGLRHMIRRRARDAGLDIQGVHRFRHTFALEFMRSGGAPHALQSLLGHESPIMTLRYGRMASDDAADQHRRHSPVEKMGLKNKQR